ncbi:histidine kinase dimerization/phosphoacceptor domain-containing protein [Micromonospora sp. NBC_00362]|uniref:histidine kinase dimerization/phosphoacceptor domain-containing protein n=1 Tax=Micromonospora sp. NBC_00362 TaxID=2975975 RepID=UPI0022525859|nr:histidine kinase dimerization/phosphoacceptor domain-containing protein [Micromonospora sp. NBC_00362]MCX5122074.1 histidine kinase dimerization/phosphoacceptor domain-containing protein [Micromonospora sp. NBC_00362]
MDPQRCGTAVPLRIARELHDIVAHYLALISVQTEVAVHALREQPDQAEEGLAHVRQAARTGIEELSTVLHHADDPESSTEPTPGLTRLGDLLDSVAAAGLRVAHHQDGEARPLPTAVDSPHTGSSMNP